MAITDNSAVYTVKYSQSAPFLSTRMINQPRGGGVGRGGAADTW